MKALFAPLYLTIWLLGTLTRTAAIESYSTAALKNSWYANYKPCVEEDFLEKTGEKWVWEPRHRMRRTTIIFKLVRAKVEPLALAVSVRSFVHWMPHSDQCVVHRTSNRGSFSVVYSTLIHKEQFISEITKKLTTNTELNFRDIG